MVEHTSAILDRTITRLVNAATETPGKEKQGLLATMLKDGQEAILGNPNSQPSHNKQGIVLESPIIYGGQRILIVLFTDQERIFSMKIKDGGYYFQVSEIEEGAYRGLVESGSSRHSATLADVREAQELLDVVTNKPLQPVQGDGPCF